MRRKLTACTIMYIAGISAGFFILEKEKTVESVCFMITVCLSLYIATELTGSERSRRVLISMMLAGFVMFAFRFYVYESCANRLLAESARNEYTVINGTVISASMKGENLRLMIRTDGSSLLTPYVYMTARGYEGDAFLLRGRRIRSAGSYKELIPADDPGCFDDRLYKRAKGACTGFSGSPPEIEEAGSGLIHDARFSLYRQRERFIERFDDETQGFLRGVIFGDKSEMDEEIRDEFDLNQTGHILAVSGLHIGFLYSLLRLLSGRRRTLLTSLTIIAVLLVYGEMTMWSAATIRACIVMSVSLLSLHLRRKADLLTSVSFAALLILVCQPYQILDAGFQMSFLAMSGIAFFTRPLSAKLGEFLGTAVSVQLGTAPVAAYVFYRANLLSVFINIPVILLSSFLVPVCILLLLIQIVSGAVPGPGIEAAEFLAHALIDVNHMLTFGGGYSNLVPGIGAAAVIAYYVFAFGLASEWTRIRLVRKDHKAMSKAAAALLVPLLVLASCCFNSLSDDEVIFVSVGQGDCTHIRYRGRNFLIDGGGSEEYNVGETTVMPYLLRSGAGSVDIALATHLHTDHFKGIEELSAAYPVAAVGIPADYRDYAEQSPDIGSELFYVKPGTVIHTGASEKDPEIEAIWPVNISGAGFSPDDANEHNTVYMIHYGGVRVMVTGDLLEEDELAMVSYYKHRDPDALRCDVLKVAHHGSKSSTSEAFLDAVSPSVAIISVGRNNLYGHPHAQTLDRLAAHGITTYRTDINGAIGLDIRKGKIRIDTYH